MASTQKKKKGNFEIGVNLRVTQCFDKGSRNYMEDFSKYYFEKDPTNNQSVVFAFFGVFDGHGGTEAAELAHRCLLDEIKSQEKFWSLNDQDVLDAIREGFLRTHQRMVDARGKWPLTPSGFQSTAGTTASIALIRNRKLYVGHVGDSAIVVGRCPPDSKDSATDNWTGNALTVSSQGLRNRSDLSNAEHKPDHPEERRRIEAHGGSVRRKAGIHRVVWNRPKPTRHLENAQLSRPEATPEFEEIPFLAVARSLGDLWSFDAETGQFHVSPEPDCAVYDLRPHEHRCVIIGSDGLWNVIKPEAAVELVRLCERETEARVFADFGVAPNFFYHPAGTLVQFALERCSQRQVRSDNVTAVVVMVDPAGKPMTQLRQERRRLFFSRLGLDEPTDGAAHQGLVRRLLVESQRARGDSAGTAPVPAEAEEEKEEEGGDTTAKVRLGPAACALRQALMGSSGFPSLLAGWSDPCWRAMQSYCADSRLAAAALLEHLMDMDVKFRKEALLAVPAVVSLKRAFTHDWEMSVCLAQLPLLAPEWTQLLVLCGASPPSSPSSSPSAAPSPSRRWIERRERILGVLYALLAQRPTLELSKEARGLMRAHAAREEKALRARTAALPAPELAAVIKAEPEPPSPPSRTRAQRRGTAVAFNGRPALRRGAPASPVRLNGAPPRKPKSPEGPKPKSPEGPKAKSSELSKTKSSEGSRTKTPEGSRTKSPEGSKTKSSEGSRTKSPEGSKSKSSEGLKAKTSEGSRTKTPEGSKAKTPEGSKTKTPEVSKTKTPEGSKAKTPEGSRTKTPEGSKTQGPEVSKSRTSGVSKTRSAGLKAKPEESSKSPERSSRSPEVPKRKGPELAKRKTSEVAKSKNPVESTKTSEGSPQGSSPRTLRHRSQSPASASVSGSPPAKVRTPRTVEIRPKSAAAGQNSVTLSAGQKSQIRTSAELICKTSSLDQISKTTTPTVGQWSLTLPVGSNSKTTPSVRQISLTSTPVGANSNTTPSVCRTKVLTGQNSHRTSDPISHSTPGPISHSKPGPDPQQPASGPTSLTLLIPPAQSDASSPPLLPAAQPFGQSYRARKRPQSIGHFAMDAEAEAEVDSLMRKLVVTFTPDPAQLKQFDRRLQPTVPRPKPVLPPKPKPHNEEKEREEKERKEKEREEKERKEEKEKEEEKKKEEEKEKPAPAIIPDRANSRFFCKRVVIDATAEARLEEMMRQITARTTEKAAASAPKPPEAPKPEAAKPQAQEEEAAEEEDEAPAKRRRLQSEELPRRRLRLRTARSDL